MNKTNKKSILYTIIIVMVAVIIGELGYKASNYNFKDGIEYVIDGIGRLCLTLLSCVGTFYLIGFIIKIYE